MAITIIEKWMDDTPTLIEAAPYDDLREYYYVLSVMDTVNQIRHIRQSVFYNLQYAELATAKEKKLGYWNAAVGYSILKML